MKMLVSINRKKRDLEMQRPKSYVAPFFALLSYSMYGKKLCFGFYLLLQELTSKFRGFVEIWKFLGKSNLCI